MIIHIQAVPSREKWVSEMILPNFKRYKCITHIDKDYTGPMNCYFEMLKSIKDEPYNFRLHLQDDVFLAYNLEAYLEELSDLMQERDIDILTLSVLGNRKYMREAVKYQKKIVPYEGDFYGMQGLIFSKKADDIQREYMGVYNNKINDYLAKELVGKDRAVRMYQLRQADDLFLHHAIAENGLKIYSHAPTLVEHNEKLKSTFGFVNNGKRNSGVFDVNFINRKYGKEEN